MIVYLICVVLLVIILLAINLFIAAHMPDTEKLSPFECGMQPVYGQTRAPFTIQYYLVGLLFIVFDLEVSLLYPLGSYLAGVNVYGFAIAALFYIILTIGFVVEIASGALHFTDQRAAIH